MAKRKGKRQKKWPKYFFLLVPLCATLLSLVVIELMLTVFWPISPAMARNMYYRADPHTGFAHEPGAIGSYHNGILAIANSHGFRDDEVPLEKPPGTRRILVIGDSFTVGENVEMGEAYPQVLEQLLNQASGQPVEVINAAVGGWEPFQYAQYFDHHGSEFSPDSVIVGFFVGNDTYNEIESVDETATVVTGQRVSREAAAGNFVRLRVLLHRHLNLVRLLHGTSFVNVHFDRRDCEDFAEFTLDVARTRLTNHRVDVNTRPDLAAKSLHHIRRIKQKTDRMGIRLIVVLIPDELQINEKLRQRLVTQDELSIYDFTMPQQMLVREFATLGIETLDLLPFFRRDERCLYMNDTHWTPEGHVIAASAIAEYVSRNAGRPINAAATISGPETKSTNVNAQTAGANTALVVEAVETIQTYTAMLKKTGFNGSVVVDISLLPFPKDKIRAASSLLNLVATDPAEQDSYAEVAKTLAFFQPEVGDTPISLDEIRSDGDTWRSIVVAEMQDIHVKLNIAPR